MDKEELKEHQEIINRIGTAALMEDCEVTKGAISQWRKNGIPKARLKYLKLSHPEAFIVPRKANPTKQPRKGKQ